MERKDLNIYTGKLGYNSTKTWQQRSEQALAERGQLYAYDTESDRSALRQWLADNMQGNVLEVGCGFGHWAQDLQGSYATYTGVDVIAERVAHARELRRLHNVTFEHVTGDWDLRRKFDAIISVTVIQHLLMPEAITLLKAIERHLAPGGVALLAEWRIWDITAQEAEDLYNKETNAAHMIPKPLQVLRDAVPELTWAGNNGQFILYHKGQNIGL